MVLLLTLVVIHLCVTVGYGLGLLRLLGHWQRGGPHALTLGDAGLFGLVVLAVLGTALNFVSPLSQGVTAAVSVLGIVLLVAERRHVSALVAFGGAPIVTAVALFVVAITVTIPLLLPLTSPFYDTGLYHLQATLHAIDEPLIFGISNLHARFGYNSLWFVLGATLFRPWGGLESACLLNPLISICVITAIIQRIMFSVCAPGHIRSALFGTGALVTLFSPYLVLVFLGSLGTDLAGNLLIPYTVLLIIGLSDADPAAADGYGADLALCVIVFSVFAVTVKLSALPLLALVALVLLGRHAGLASARGMKPAFGFVTLLAGLWMGRGLATSGCLAYPNVASCLPLPWGITLRLAQDDADSMRAWARLPRSLPETVLGTWDWLPAWLSAAAHDRHCQGLAVLAAIAAIGVMVRLCGTTRRTVWEALPRRQARASALLLLFSLLAVAFWFVSAPLLRYGYGWLTLLVLLVLVHGFPILVTPCEAPPLSAVITNRRQPGLWRQLAGFTGRRGAIRLVSTVSVLGAALVLVRRPDQLLMPGAFPPVPVVAIETRMTDEGLAVHVPASGDQCWAAPRPCTPAFSPNLQVKQIGLWRMMHYPAP